MTCTQFRESVDCYVDGELSAAASAAADAHRRDCPACALLVQEVLTLKAGVKRTVGGTALPPQLARRIETAIAGPQTRLLGMARALRPRRPMVALAALAAGFVLIMTIGPRFSIAVNAANAMDRLALRLDETSEVVLDGQILCRDCELEHEYGIEASCPLIGHHGAIATADGQIWNIVEQPASAALIHDEALLGRKIVARGRLFRSAHAVVITQYELKD